MNPQLRKLVERLKALKIRQADMVKAAETEDRDFTEDETTAFAALQEEVTQVDNRRQRLSDLLEAEKTEVPVETFEGDGSSNVTVKRPNFVEDPKKGFRNSLDFFTRALTTSRNRHIEDERLRYLVTDKDGVAIHQRRVDENGLAIGVTAGSDEQSTFADPYGGFFIPEAFTPGPLQLTPEASPFPAGMGPTMIPMAAPVVKLNARVDKNHSSSVSGGFQVYRRAESDTAAATRTAYEQIELRADTLYGVAYATEELLRDSPVSFAAIIDAGFRDEMPNKEMDERINGTGVGEFTGVLNAACKIDVAEESPQTADTIVAENVINMRARCYGYSNAIWLYNHDALPQLMSMVLTVGTAGVLVWQENVRDDHPATILGRPAIACGYCKTVGDSGDLILADWSQYLEGTYQPFETAESAHVRFLENERTFRVTKRNAAVPWWRSAFTPQVSTTTLSPIITLQERA